MNHFHHSKKRKRIRGVSPALAERARELRKAMTPAERALWKRLKLNQLGVRFRRQHAVGRIILDFYCPACKLVIEVDGAIHKSRAEYDEARTRELESYGYRVVRFSNEDVLNDADQVIERIYEALAQCDPRM